MSEIKNPRIHPEIPSVLAVLVAPMNKILTIGAVTSQGHLTLGDGYKNRQLVRYPHKGNEQTLSLPSIALLN